MVLQGCGWSEGDGGGGAEKMDRFRPDFLAVLLKIWKYFGGYFSFILATFFAEFTEEEKRLIMCGFGPGYYCFFFF